MIVTFSYPLPDELYIEGISGKVTGTYTYNGPETFDVHIDVNGNVIDVNVENDPEMGPDYRKTINASTHTPVAYYFYHYFQNEYNWDYEFEDELMENGDVYKKILNPNLNDVYEVIFDISNNDWKLNQILKKQDNPSSLEAQKRKEYIEKYAEKYSFGIEIDNQIDAYIKSLDTFISNNPPVKTWKYTNFNLNSIPKLPAIIAIEIAKLPSEGV